MTAQYSFYVDKDGEGWSAFARDEKGKSHRLSPTWVRDVLADEPQQVKVPLREKGQLGVVTRLVSKVVGKKLVVGESLISATGRAERAMRRQAAGLPFDIPKEKKVA